LLENEVRICGFVFVSDEPGKQVRSAIKLKNTSKSHTAFKVMELCVSFTSILAIDSRISDTYLRTS